MGSQHANSKHAAENIAEQKPQPENFVAPENWSFDDWQSYLLSLERPLKEALISPYSYDALAELQTTSIFEHAQETCAAKESSRIWVVMKTLSGRQREVIHLIFWRGMSEREIAAYLEISRSSVKVIKKRALLALAKGLVTHSTLMEAQTNNASEME